MSHKQNVTIRQKIF